MEKSWVFFKEESKECTNLSGAHAYIADYFDFSNICRYFQKLLLLSIVGHTSTSSASSANS